MASIRYFEEIITPEDLQKAIVKNGLSERIPAIADPIGLSNAARIYFLWTGVNDQYNWYPIFNAMIEYIKANSKTYGK